MDKNMKDQREIETDKIEKVSEKSAYERFGKTVQGILIAWSLGMGAWAWTISTDVAILKSSQLTSQDLKELKSEIKEAIKEGFDKIDIKTSKQLDDHELRIRVMEKK